MNYNTFNSNTNFNSANNIEDYINMLFPYNHHSSLSFNPSSFIPNHHHHHHNHLDHHHHHHQQQLLQPSPFPQFEFDSDLALFTSFLPQNNGQDDVFPLSNTLIEEQSLDQASETITHIEESQRISISQDPKMKKLNNKRNRTDKHSKIKTAKGTRDRRMRLSLDVATKLFGLQDMLGFDKASKTVEWLLTQAKPEIIKIATSLSHQLNNRKESDCFTSDDESPKRSKGTSLCEIASFLTEEHGDNSINTTDKIDGRSIRGKRKSLQPRTLILKKLSKEERAKARERAKDRTKEKMMLKRRSQVNVVDQFHDNHEILKNSKSDMNSNWNKEIQESYYKNDRFAICEEIEMNQDHHRISDESYDLINRLNSSFPMSFYHRSQGAATSIEQQNQFMLNQPRDRMYNSQNMS